jgi:uncharacterized C2H2 Zn-finger protein
MKQNETNLTSKNTQFFECIFCDFLCSKKGDYNRHLLTKKHKMKQNETKDVKKSSNPLECNICNTLFKSRTTLWRHKKTCFIKIEEKEEIVAEEDQQKELIQYLMKENSEFKQLMIDQNKQMIELAKKAGNTTTNSHNTNSNNSFNLNFFLNETCKNAMNIMDFVSQLQVGIKDLEETGKLGFADGISKIFINGLKQIDITDRPVHCSDFKRETLYIKSNDQWNKENEEKTILINAIKHVAHKNIKQINEWTKEHPMYKDSESKENDKYLKIVSQAMSGSTQDETNKNYVKIIKNILCYLY